VALEGLSKEQIEQYEADLLEKVPQTGAIGNVSLRAELAQKQWSEELYWDIRNRLIERGLLVPGKGKGGSVRRVPPKPVAEPVEAPDAQPVVAEMVPAERDLYKPMAEVIRTRWAQDYRLDSLFVEITAAGDARQAGGKWTRPDITVASYRTFAYVPGRHFDLITFEIKPFNALDVTVVYEALGHRRAATRSYALIYLPDDSRAELQTLLDEICIEAKRFGIGVIVAARPEDYDTWEELVEAVRHEPDPERLNEFLAQQVSQGFREQIIKWFK
jgi:hypothetical protein